MKLTQSRRKKHIVYYVHDTEHDERKIFYYAHRNELTKQENVYYVYNIKHFEHNVFNTNFIYLYSENRFLK